MTTVLESMARAIYDITYGHSDPTETPFAWSQSVSAARAALIALRDGVDVFDGLDAIGAKRFLNHVLQGGEKDTESAD